MFDRRGFKFNNGFAFTWSDGRRRVIAVRRSKSEWVWTFLQKLIALTGWVDEMSDSSFTASLGGLLGLTFGSGTN
jgi:hypothetical protein